MKLSSKITTFKAQFGNVTHIKIVEKMGELNKYIELLHRKRTEARGIDAVKTKVEQLENEIIKLIEFAESQQK
jgi:hypothetical protein